MGAHRSLPPENTRIFLPGPPSKILPRRHLCENTHLPGPPAKPAPRHPSENIPIYVPGPSGRNDAQGHQNCLIRTEQSLQPAGNLLLCTEQSLQTAGSLHSPAERSLQTAGNLHSCTEQSLQPAGSLHQPFGQGAPSALKIDRGYTGTPFKTQAAPSDNPCLLQRLTLSRCNQPLPLLHPTRRQIPALEARAFILEGKVRSCAVYEGKGSPSDAAHFLSEVASSALLPATCVLDGADRRAWLGTVGGQCNLGGWAEWLPGGAQLEENQHNPMLDDAGASIEDSVSIHLVAGDCEASLAGLP